MTDPVAYYHSLLEDEQTAAESLGVLQGGQAQRSLYFGRHPLCSSLRPNLLSAARYQAVVAASHSISDALTTLEQVLLVAPVLRRELDLDPEEEMLSLADTRCSVSSPSSRLDGFFSDELRYVEYNAESPAGIAYGDNLTDVFESLPVMKAFRLRYAVRPLPVRQLQYDALIRAFLEWGGSDKPVAVIVDWPGLPTLTEFEMFREYFEARGLRTLISEPAGLDFRGGTLYADGEPVNLVYRRVLAAELAENGGDHSALREAYLAGAACVVNSFRTKLLNKKMSLALLSDPRYASLYTSSQREAIARHIPWTRKVAEGPSTRHGLAVADLVAYVNAHRNELVLKPNDDYGGKGVVLGWTVDAHEWEQAVEIAVTQSYVVQEAVPTPRESFPLALRDSMHFVDLTVDLDPYLFYGRVGGCLTRLSSSALLNVTAGSASVVPTYVVDGPR